MTDTQAIELFKTTLRNNALDREIKFKERILELTNEVKKLKQGRRPLDVMNNIQARQNLTDNLTALLAPISVTYGDIYADCIVEIQKFNGKVKD